MMMTGIGIPISHINMPLPIIALLRLWRRNDRAAALFPGTRCRTRRFTRA